MKALAVLVPVLLVAARGASAGVAPAAQQISFTVVVGSFNQTGSRVGGGICLGDRRATDPRRYSGVQWSPDGRRFAFWRQTGSGTADVFVANADGSGERNLTAGTGVFNWSPAWAPDGARIAYNAAGPPVTQLVTMQPDGRDKVPLAATALPSEFFAAHPSWSPDGRIFYTRSTGAADPVSIWSVRAAGDDHRKVIESAFQPDVSPDGRLAYSSGRDLFVAGPDGTGARELVRGFDHTIEEPEWSPDGTKIAALRIDQRDPKIYDVRDEMLLADVASGAVRTLRGPLGAWSPTWRPGPVSVGARPCVIAGTRRGDRLNGTRRGDLIYARGGADLVRAGGGDDVVLGEGGSDRIFAGTGNDVIGAQDNRRDLVDGGPGRDLARVDRRRDAVRSIERRLP